ncbi:GNAT family N-acetyltransferase [Maritalea sp.]|uniref:GNAT family N-acetyltransferase n=1 Tax=Maritalea sp. TaxID=2003361 RepID=UPI003EF42BDC
MYDPQNLDLCWQVEEACALAWPTKNIQPFNGYEFRHTPGATTRRNNSVNPTRSHQMMTSALIEEAATHYNALNKKLIVRVPDMISEAEALLDKEGFGPAEAKTKTLFASSLDGFELQNQVEVSSHADEAWVQFAANRAQWTREGRQSFLKALLEIGYPILFAHIEVDQELAAIAYAVVVEDVAIIESVETAPQFRRQGRAAKLLSSLLARCRSLGATKAALQVVAQNEAARALYHKLGFTTELYDYHYRTKMGQDAQ